MAESITHQEALHRANRLIHMMWGVLGTVVQDRNDKVYKSLERQLTVHLETRVRTEDRVGTTEAYRRGFYAGQQDARLHPKEETS